MKISHFPGFLPRNSDLVYPHVIAAIEKTDTLVAGVMDADAAIIWSVLWFGKMSGNRKVWNHYREQGKPVIVIEVGGLVRNETWKLGIDGINARANFGNMENLDDTRVRKLGLELKDWKTQGDYILVCGQHAHSEQWLEQPDMDTYYKNTVTEIRKYSDKPIVLRSHPRFREGLHFPCDLEWYKDKNVEWNTPVKILETYDSFDLENLFNHTAITYSYSSNAGVSSIIHGVPAVVDKQSLAYPMSSQPRIIQTPDRTEWLRKMSYVEWYPEEIGEQWLRIREYL